MLPEKKPGEGIEEFEDLFNESEPAETKTDPAGIEEILSTEPGKDE